MCNEDKILEEQEISAEELDSVAGGIGQQETFEPNNNWIKLVKQYEYYTE